MSVNKLNLQIGGGDQDDYARRKVMREVSRTEINTDVEIDNFLDDLFFEETQQQPVERERTIIREQAPVVPRSNVDVLSQYISKTVKEEPKLPTQRSLREGKSIEERMTILEQDVFRVQAQATPNTLVAGIGASLDSGGGAVWLWDLNDVEIGTPMNGVYPPTAYGS